MFIHSAFPSCFLIGFSCNRLLVCFRVISSQLLVEFPFIVLEYPVLSVLFYPNLPSFACTFWFIFSIFTVIFFLVLPFSFRSYILQRLSLVLSSSPVFVDFLSAFLVEFPILVLILSSCFLRGSQFSHNLILPQHRLVHLIRLYYSFIYKVVLDLFYSFPS